jgi:hypothetical protein
MTDYKATPAQWANVQKFATVAGESCILELRARVETLEAAAHKHIVETSASISALISRIESLEAAERQASKVHQISEPLKLTPDQAKQVKDQLGLNLKSTPDSNQIVNYRLVERVEDALMESIKDQGSMARAAIREVAMWMRENEVGYTAARWLEQEANL